MNPEASITIYNQLINGSAINKHTYSNGVLESNPLFDEVIMYIQQYRSQYALIGFELEAAGDSFFIRERGASEQYRDATMKIQVLMEVLSRHMADIPLRPEALLDHQGGLSQNYIGQIGSHDEVKDILTACGLAGDLLNEVEKNLVSRKLAFWNNKESLVLSDAGEALFNDLFSGDEGSDQVSSSQGANLS